VHAEAAGFRSLYIVRVVFLPRTFNFFYLSHYNPFDSLIIQLGCQPINESF
jgi:hypothetical protein